MRTIDNRKEGMQSQLAETQEQGIQQKPSVPTGLDVWQIRKDSNPRESPTRGIRGSLNTTKQSMLFLQADTVISCLVIQGLTYCYEVDADVDPAEPLAKMCCVVQICLMVDFRPEEHE